MPFAVGWHPAFLTFPDEPGDHFVRVMPAGRGIPQIHYIDDIKKRSHDGSIIEPSSEAEYVFPHGRISISSSLDHLQLWSPENQNQVCIEPISAPPNANYDGELSAKRGYRILPIRSAEKFEFRVGISVRL
jgi:galactose mutarotase-like enzyme